MTDRWEVERAVLGSQLDPYARLIMLALLAKADNRTAVIPPEHTPSLTTIQAMTGLGRSSVTEYLGMLESGGWVSRTKPQNKERRERTQYALHPGESPLQRPSRASRVPKGQRTRPHSGLELGRTAAQQESESSTSTRPHSGTPVGGTRPHSGLELGRTAAPTRPHSGPATTKSSPTENSSTQVPPLASLTDDPADDAKAETAQTILARFIDYCAGRNVKVPPRSKGHYAKEIKEALDGGIEPRLIRWALHSMYENKVVGHPSYLSNHIVRVQTGPERRNGRHKAHQNDPNVDYNEEL